MSTFTIGVHEYKQHFVITALCRSMKQGALHLHECMLYQMYYPQMTLQK